MDVRGRRATVAAVVFAGGLVAAAPAGASRGQCVAAAHGHKVVAESTRGLVYSKGEQLVGCSYAGGRVSVLPGQGRLRMSGHAHAGTARIDGIRIAGRFVAYGSHWTESHASAGHLGPPTTERVISFDLRAGAIRYATQPNNGTDTRLNALVVKPDGSVAWMYESIRILANAEQASGIVVVKMDRETGGREHGLDSDSFDQYGRRTYRIGRRSLGLSANGRRIYWTARFPQTGAVHHLSARLL